jgi:predicted RNase H-like HicB family nuclease
MMLKVEIAQEIDGRWIGEIPDLPGVMAYGDSREVALAKANKALALRVIADRLDHGEIAVDLARISFAV